MAPKRQRISKSDTNNDHEMSWSQSIHETVKGCHQYKIIGYSLAKGLGVGEYMTSGIFTVGGHEWVIQLYPGGNTENCKECVSMYLQLVRPGQEEVRAFFEFNLLDQSGKKKHGTVLYKYPRTFKTGSTIWGWDEYILRSDLETLNFLKDDCLSIHCTVEVVKTHVETMQTRDEEGKQFIPVPPSDMIRNLKSLLKSGIGSDITFQVGNESFKAHKSILAAQCPVFQAQFFGLVGNPELETVAIEEFDPFAFKAMLLFLYSDKIPEPRELSDLDAQCTSTTIMEHLLVAADRFVLARLKLMCESKLCEEITANTVATTLVLADRYQCLQLKTACLNFAAKPENMGEVIKSDGFAQLEKTCPLLFIDLFKAGAEAVHKK